MDPETKATLDELLAGGEPTMELVAPEEQEVLTPRTTSAPSPTPTRSVAAVTKGERQQLAKQRWKKAARQVAKRRQLVVGSDQLDKLGLRDAAHAKEVMAHLEVASFEMDNTTGALQLYFVDGDHRREAHAWIVSEMKKTNNTKIQTTKKTKTKTRRPRGILELKVAAGDSVAHPQSGGSDATCASTDAEHSSLRKDATVTCIDKDANIVGGADGGGETKREAGHASSHGGVGGDKLNQNSPLSQRARRVSIADTRAPSTLESRVLMIHGLVRSKN